MITEPLTVHLAPMRKKHVRSVLRIEEQVYPRPWSNSLFLSELALRTTRAYFIARIGRDLVGYGGLMTAAEDGHITTIAVDPRWHRHKVGTRLMIGLAREAVARDARNLTLEVRMSNLAAQHLYRRFGFAPVGVRKNYYQDAPAPRGARNAPSQGSGPAHDADERLPAEDALVMWVHEINTPEYAALLDSIERGIPGETRFE